MARYRGMYRKDGTLYTFYNPCHNVGALHSVAPALRGLAQSEALRVREADPKAAEFSPAGPCANAPR
jgi:hypothetical protein